MEGPCPALPHQTGRLPGCQLRRPTAKARHPRVVAVSRPLPRLRSFPLRWCPFSAVKVFLLFWDTRRKPSRDINGEFFAIHRSTVVIRTWPWLSTGFFTAYPQARARPRTSCVRVEPACPPLPKFAGVSLPGGAQGLGTIDPGNNVQGPLHIWDGGGLARPCRTRLASCPACPAPTAGRQGQTSAGDTGFPAPPTSPEFPPEVVPVSSGRSISTPRAVAAQALEDIN
jgi:hypothetical protein